MNKIYLNLMLLCFRKNPQAFNPHLLWWQINQFENDVMIGVFRVCQQQNEGWKLQMTYFGSLPTQLYHPHAPRCCTLRYQKNKCPSYWLILYPARKADWDPEGPIWTPQGLCWPSLRPPWVDLDPEDPVGPWVDLDASTRIGVATTVGTYKASAPAPSDLELISSAASKEKTPGLICLWKFFEENAAIWRFTMNGLHLNLKVA